MLSQRMTRFVVALLLFVGCVGCDQATKHLATRNLRGGPPKSYLGNTVRLEYALNPGGFLSLGSRLSPAVRYWFFVLLNVAFLVAIPFVLFGGAKLSLLAFVAVVLLAAGAAGNLVDRVSQDGFVTDFLNLGIGPIRTGIFNVADMAITLGAVMLLLPRRADPEDAEPEDNSSK